MTPKQEAALRQAREALERHAELGLLAGATIAAIDEALAEQPAQQRPQNCGTGYCSCIECLFEQPAQLSKPLTDEQIMEMYNEPRSDAEMLEFARAIEAAHGIKGDT